MTNIFALAIAKAAKRLQDFDVVVELAAIDHHLDRKGCEAPSRLRRKADPRLGDLDDEKLLSLLRRAADGAATSGVVCDLLIETGAFGTKPTEGRKAIQQRVDKALTRHRKPRKKRYTR